MRPRWVLLAVPLFAVACVWGRARDFVRDDGSGDGGVEPVETDETGTTDDDDSSEEEIEDAGFDADDGAPRRYVFVTSSDIEGSHPDGIKHFDGICNGFAEGVELLEGKKFAAWLSTKKEGALTHVKADSWTGRYVLVTGEIVALTSSDLTHDVLPKPINVDAYGNVVTEPDRVWTGTNDDGGLAIPDCVDWTSSTAKGWTGKTTGAWTHAAQTNCADTALLYCFEVP
ncbi:MAG: hypothetical protein KIT84_09140 [Labilithrix sp.]|nr:hypothetical protein [Labilithrix sp.]MCW5811165.1 hypothetical protein [Labilithrix sp.]